MRFWFGMVVAACLLVSCTDRSVPANGAAAAGIQIKPISKWLDPQTKLDIQVSLITLNGRDIRQAGYYFPDAASRRVAVLIRDYSRRRTGIPDDQSLLIVDPVAGRGELQPVADSAVPASLVFNEDHSRGVVGLLQPLASESGSPWKTVIQSLPHESVSVSRNYEQLFLPVRINTDGRIICRQLTAVQLEGGIPAPATDWTAALIEIQSDGRLLSFAGRDWITPQRAGWAAGYSVQYSPTNPAAAAISLEVISDGSTPLQQFSLPFHVTYSAFEWLPVFQILDDQHLASVSFLPDVGGRSSRPSYGGVFRITILDTDSGNWNLVEDHLEADIGLVVEDRILFYARAEPGEANRWGVWAADSTGTLKRRLWLVDDSVHVSVADSSGNGQILVERQYFDEALGAPQLHSELREISLESLDYNSVVSRNHIVRNIIDGTQAPVAQPGSQRPPPIAGVSL